MWVWIIQAYHDVQLIICSLYLYIIDQGLINYIDTKAIFRHLKKIKLLNKKIFSKRRLLGLFWNSCAVLNLRICNLRINHTYLRICALRTGTHHRARIPSPLPLRVAKTSRNHLNEEFTPLLPTGIGERFYPNLNNLGHAAPLRRCELPLWTKVLNQLINSLQRHTLAKVE